MLCGTGAVACGTPQVDRALASRAGEPEQLLDVPFHPQRRNHCGPASLAMVLEWSGDTVTPQELDETAFTAAREGSLQLDMLSAARRRGRLAYPVRDLASLLAELDAGHPVLVLQNLGLRWYQVWHFSVAIGHDLQRGVLIQHTGRDQARPISLRTFERTWDRADDWGLVVLPAGTLPARADEPVYLRAALGLELAGRPVEAAAAFDAATARWPDSLGAWMGLGNARYASGDLDGAERAFRSAAEAHPGSGPALNNLAQVLFERGHGDDALETIDRAIALGGPRRATYERTRDEIRESHQATP
ncbi:MAG: PA2778 family cysteine peptidase [Deltaproteobacteria bacterium]|nr:PA2778 family cysteine peptidase [Deltaproteobacteria bacterium]